MISLRPSWVGPKLSKPFYPLKKGPKFTNLKLKIAFYVIKSLNLYDFKVILVPLKAFHSKLGDSI